MDAELIRICPSCNAENAPSVMRCACGALLAGVDLIDKRALDVSNRPEPPAAAPEPVADETGGVLVCPYDDCAQPNPPGSSTCVYCNRPLASTDAPPPTEAMRSLLNLPAALKARYRIVKPLPAQGAEAELMLVEAIALTPTPLAEGEGLNTETRVAKIYRHGILPKTDVQERIARVPVAHRVTVLETGVSEGYAYEVMEWCRGGSLRSLLEPGPLDAERLYTLVRELAEALRDVHAAGLAHRDLKPENILIRSEQPLDLVLTDFSIASLLDATQRFTGVARTMPYASPESLSGVIDAKTDYWALGMIVLECATGRHPFAGLSEPVILHHLTTRSIDLSGVGDAKIRKLLRGLLLRDPKTRWGEPEIARWLADDPALTEPMDHAGASAFAAPYRIGNEVCDTPEQLAVALARHWPEGIADLRNGQLLDWFRDTCKDQNVVRLLLDNQFEKKLSSDVQLLKLILHLAPGIPPVWRGATIELRQVLTQANRALKGDGDAERWLDELYRHRVLEVYAQAGNRPALDLVERWNRVGDCFAEAWREQLALIESHAPEQHYLDIVNFGQLQYGVAGPEQPPLARMHARMLAIAYDDSWAERLRQRLLAELSRFGADCPWLAALGDPRQMDAANLLVLEALLPEIRQTAERQRQAEQRRRELEAAECIALRKQAGELMGGLRKTARRWAFPGVCDELGANLPRYLELVAKIQASARTDEAWLEMFQYAGRGRVAARVMLEEVHRLSEHRAVTSGWLNGAVLRVYLLALMVLVPFLGLKGWALWLAGAVGTIVWRLLPDFFKMRKIRKLAGSL